MITAEIFHRQLINSYVAHVAKTEFEQFMVRSELLNRTRAIAGVRTYDRTTDASDASIVIFFNGDRRAYEEQWKAANLAPDAIYQIRTAGLGSTTILEIG